MNCAQFRGGSELNQINQLSSSEMNEETKLSLLIRAALATAFTCVAVKWMVDQLDPTRDKKIKAKQQAKVLLNKLQIKSNIQVN